MTGKASYRKTVDGIEFIFARNAEGQMICAPVSVDLFDAYIEGLGSEGLQKRVAELRAGNDNVAWQSAAQQRLDEIGDKLRRERLEEQRVAIEGR